MFYSSFTAGEGRQLPSRLVLVAESRQNCRKIAGSANKSLRQPPAHLLTYLKKGVAEFVLPVLPCGMRLRSHCAASNQGAIVIMRNETRLDMPNTNSFNAFEDFDARGSPLSASARDGIWLLDDDASMLKAQ